MVDKWTVTVEEDENGDLVLPLPNELLQELDWKIGDTLSWKEVPGGVSFILSKVDKCE